MSEYNRIVKGSSMRFNLLLAGIGSLIILLALSVHIIVYTFDKTPIDWGAMGVFTAGVASVITGASWTKAKQKEIEIKQDEKI